LVLSGASSELPLADQHTVKRLEPPARFDHVRGDVSVKAGEAAFGHDDGTHGQQSNRASLVTFGSGVGDRLSTA